MPRYWASSWMRAASAWALVASASRSPCRTALPSTLISRRRVSSRCLRRSTFSARCNAKEGRRNLVMHDAGDRNHRILFTLRPEGTPVPENFGADTTAVPTPGPGQFLSRTLYLSLDPLYRAAMRGNCDASLRLNPGDVMNGETVAQVLESRHPDYRPGEYIVVRNGWQQFALSSGQGVRRLDPAKAPVSTALGVLGLPGLVGYAGLIYLGEPRPGQTVLVSAATGPVGCTAGQAARIVGARAVGIAGSREKCDYAVQELGYAACINPRSGDLAAQIRAACPDGVDVYFDNVGGEVLCCVVQFLAPHARVIL